MPYSGALPEPGPAVDCEKELTEAINLCDQRGRLNSESIGWSRKPVHDCRINGRWPRKKRWNYWCMATDTHLFSVTLSDLDYMGMAFVYFLQFDNGRFIEKTVTAPLGRGCILPPGTNDAVRFDSRAMGLSFTPEGAGTRIRVSSPSFGGVQLDADIVVERPDGYETMNVVIPWGPKRFQFTSKQNCLPAAGWVRLGDEEIRLEPKRALACLDFGRGVWPYAVFWNWASCSGVENGRTVGLNLGAGWTDGTGMTENALFVDGHLTKLAESISFTYDRNDIMKPWMVRSIGSERVNLRFEPFFERVARTNALVLRSEMHQMIGRFSGTITAAGGEQLSLTSLIGWAEEHQARW